MHTALLLLGGLVTTGIVGTAVVVFVLQAIALRHFHPPHPDDPRYH